MTPSVEREPLLLSLGAEPVICDAYDGEALTAAVVCFRPDLVFHELTDLPDDARDVKANALSNARMRRDATRNLLVASHLAGGARASAQNGA